MGLLQGAGIYILMGVSYGKFYEKNDGTIKNSCNYLTNSKKAVFGTDLFKTGAFRRERFPRDCDDTRSVQPGFFTFPHVFLHKDLEADFQMEISRHPISHRQKWMAESNSCLNNPTRPFHRKRQLKHGLGIKTCYYEKKLRS